VAPPRAIFPPQLPKPRTERTWPGQIFAQRELPYAQQMSTYAEQRRAKRTTHPSFQRRREPPDAQEQLSGAFKALRGQHREQRWAWRTRDTAWREAKAAHAATSQAWWRLPKAAREQQSALQAAEKRQWEALCTARRAELTLRKAETAQWHQARADLRKQASQLAPGTPTVSAWLAILVVIDNCTRRCVGSPLFSSGPHVTCEEVVNALRPLLPSGLAFLISDNGQQFRALPFSALASRAHFVHVRIAPYRPRSNGIAERFVQTLKGLLVEQSWQGAEQLAALLPDCQLVYNDRPHQGAELKGLSPNEYARVLASHASC
jgi:transposase InsO family protein